MIPTRHVPEVLGRSRELVAPALRRAVDQLSCELRQVAEYHLGWTDVDGRPTGGDGGKGVRPALAILSAEAAGADGAVGVPGAVAVELVHNFSLIHDDVIDEDAERRHRPTVWALFGIGRAVIAGDALLALAQQVLLDAVGDQRGAGSPAIGPVRCIADATAEMIAGQALDMAFESLPGVDLGTCLAMEAGKTGALLGCAASVGALLAGAGPDVVAALRAYGLELGLAFQAVDDLLGIWGDPAATGKPTWSDLRRHKKTLPVAAALSSVDDHAGELRELLKREHLDEGEIERAAGLVEACGGRRFAQEEANRRFDAAITALDVPGVAPRARAELVELANFVVERDF